MKPDSPFSKLPSLGELLNHPTVQGVVKRVNQTTIAQRATGFLEELQASWKEQGGVPSVGELADRLAKRLLGRAQHTTPIVNATGVLCSRRWQAPLAEAAVHEILRFASDYQQPSSELHEQVAASLAKLTGAGAAWVCSSFEAGVSISKQQCEGATIASCPLIGLIDPAELGQGHVETISDRLAAGDDVVVVDGSGLLGGPRCGIVVGRRDCVEKIRQSELAAALVADAMVLAALEATLELYRTKDKPQHHVPVLQLLATPLENLKQRCERIAPLLAQNELVASTAVTPGESVWLDTGDSQLSAASYSIVVQVEEGKLDSLLQRNEQASPQIAARVEGQKLVLDFRAVFPRWDQHFVTALVEPQLH